MRTSLILCCSLGALVAACSGDETASDTVEKTSAVASTALSSANALGPSLVLNRMLGHARAGDWAGYVGFYGESAKFRSPADKDALIRRFESDWGDEVLAKLGPMQSATPTVEGNRATFRSSAGEEFVLFKSESGHWGFHL